MTKHKSEYELYEPPAMAWGCRVAKKSLWYCEEGQQPNAFHRMMQRLVFGLKWERIEDE